MRNRKCVEGLQSYTLESNNDEWEGKNVFKEFPPPDPINETAYEYRIAGSGHTEAIEITSTNLRNLSITIANTGSGLIRKPYLYGPQNWDYRDFSKLSPQLTEDPATGPPLTEMEKFMRIHEFNTLKYIRFENSMIPEYENEDFRKNPLRTLHQYGGGMCGQAVNQVINLYRYVYPDHRVFGRRVGITGHQVGEAFWDDEWHAFDASPAVRWLYYEPDNVTIAPTWEAVRDSDLLGRIEEWTGFNLSDRLPPGTLERWHENQDIGRQWDFNYDLRPNESVAMYPEMHGKVDKISMKYASREWYRNPCDYGSAVFTYRPDLTNATYKGYVLDESNVTQTENGLLPTDPSQPSHIVFGARSVWCFVGAQIKARFKTTGKVYVAANNSTSEAAYPSSFHWQLLQDGQTKDGVIEGKMGYAVKFEFQGDGSGLDYVEVASEVQMNPLVMPCLEYGLNSIRFEAEDMGGSSVKVTYQYDDRCTFHHYEPAATKKGRHIWVRIGGDLQHSAEKGLFWKNINRYPNKKIPVTIEIIKVSGKDGVGDVVRVVKNEEMLPFGFHKIYWDGKDNNGRECDPGMYCFRVIKGPKAQNNILLTERLYLWPEIWPLPNEQRHQQN